MRCSDIISIIALAFAIVSYIPSFIALHRTTQRVNVDIVSYSKEPTDATVELIFSLQFRNPVNMPITIHKIELSVDKQIYQTDKRVPITVLIAPNGVSNAPLVFFVPLEAYKSAKTFQFILHTSGKKIKSKKFTVASLR